VIFDGTPASATSENAPINLGIVTLYSITIRNGYNALITIPAGLQVTDVGALSVDGKSTLNMDFTDAFSGFELDGGGTITNMTLAGNPGAEFYIAGGSTTIAANPGGYTERIGVNVTLGGAAALTDWGYNSLQFTNNNLPFNVFGTMVVYHGTGSGATLIDSNGYTNDYLNVVDGGTLTYNGIGGVIDTFNVPIIVQDGGSFSVTTIPNSPAAATLIVKGTATQTHGVSVYMTGDSSVLLSSAATLECDNDYYQDGDAGTLGTTDLSPCTLQDGANADGTATIAGGLVSINGGSEYGELDIKGNLKMAGVLYVGVLGDRNVNSDLKVTGTVDLQNGALDVTVDGTPVSGDGWIIIKASNIFNDFATKNSDPQTNLIYGPPNSPNKGEYQIKFNG